MFDFSTQNEQDSDPILLNNSPANDSGIAIENSLVIYDTESESEDADISARQNEETNSKKTKRYKKPLRPCVFCRKLQTQLKRHILKKHSDHTSVMPLLKMNSKEQDMFIAEFRRQGIREYNRNVLRSGNTNFMRERTPREPTMDDIPVMCAGCKGFFSKKYKSRHQAICPESGTNLMLPMVSLDRCQDFKHHSEGFKELLNTLHLDKIGNYLKTDEIILMFGSRSFSALKRKKDKKTEAKRSVRARMRLTARVYLAFQDEYSRQSEIVVSDKLSNAGDMYRRETITVLGRAIDRLSEKSNDDDKETAELSITGQKSGLKISILNLLKLTAKFLIGHFLIKNQDERSKAVVDFIQVLKLFENELFGDAYYELNFRKNVKDRKPINLPKNSDVQLLIEECNSIMSSIDVYDFSADCYVNIRSATATALIIFNARRGGEPVRLVRRQWEEALNGEWMEREDVPEDINENILVTYQTGKGADHLVPVMFPPETHMAMKYLTDKEVRKNAGVNITNEYVFASTQQSTSHASGWHCINDILKRLDIKGAINATKNRHRVASLLSHLQLSEKEKELVFKHFGHSKEMNENVYQAAAGSLQVATTGQKLLEIHAGTSKQKVPEKSTRNSKGSKKKEDVTSREFAKLPVNILAKSSKEVRNKEVKRKVLPEQEIKKMVRNLGVSRKTFKVLKIKGFVFREVCSKNLKNSVLFSKG